MIANAAAQCELHVRSTLNNTFQVVALQIAAPILFVHLADSFAIALVISAMPSQTLCFFLRRFVLLERLLLSQNFLAIPVIRVAFPAKNRVPIFSSSFAHLLSYFRPISILPILGQGSLSVFFIFGTLSNLSILS